MSGVKNRVTVKGTVQARKTVRGWIGYRTLQGEPGTDGISPQARVDKSGDTVTITITDAEGTTTETVKDGHTPVKGTDYWTQADQTAIVNDVLASQEISDIEQDVSDVKNDLSELASDCKVVTNDLGQWLFAENKYFNTDYVLTDFSGYDTYRIPCEYLDFVALSWIGNNPFGEIGTNYRYTYEDAYGFSRSLTKLNIDININKKKALFNAPSNAVAIYFTFKASDIANNLIISKNTTHEYSKNNDYFANFSIPVDDRVFVRQKYYLYTNGNLYDWENDDYIALWYKVKAGDCIKFNSVVSGLSFNAEYRDASSPTRAVITELTHTFVSDATLVVFEKTDNLGNAVLIPSDLKLKVDSSDVIGLGDAIDEKVMTIESEIDAVSDQVDAISTKMDGTDVEYTSGQESGYYAVENNIIVEKTWGDFSRSKIEVADWMRGIVTYQISSLSAINPSAVFCAFSDANDDFISRPTSAVGTTVADIPSNAKYIYLCFYGDTYCSGYTIAANKVAMQSDIDKLDVSNPYEELTGVAFGTSLTYRAQTTGGFLQYLPNLSGITFDNQGIGSSTILGDGGNLDMLAKIKAYTGYSGKSICLLEGFVNDWYQSKSLGTWKDISETSVCGCVRSALNYIRTQNANLTVFLILDPYGRNYSNVDCSSTAVNGSSLTQYEYYEEIAKVAESLGVPVIKEYAESQIGEKTAQYLLDNIHPNALGAKQSAYFIWSQMRKYYPNVI